MKAWFIYRPLLAIGVCVFCAVNDLMGAALIWAFLSGLWLAETVDVLGRMR